MSQTRWPLLEMVSVLDLRPTQMTIGMREVNDKRKRWKEKDQGRSGLYLGTHMVPVIRGWKERLYIIDHHHLARALFDEGIDKVTTTVIGDLHKLEKDLFWYVMEHRNWAHPYAFGKRYSYDDLPRSVEDLKDDEFRSLAGELRRAGGFAKDTAPFSEFLWANYLRHKMDKREVEKDFDKALKKAIKIVRDAEAHFLPGWCGPHED
jgi:hypothetical protein